MQKLCQDFVKSSKPAKVNFFDLQIRCLSYEYRGSFI